jgi:hypothetical protein
MKKILIAAGLIGTATAGVLLYMRNRNSTSKTMHGLADDAGDAHENVKKYFRRAKNHAKHELDHTLA